MGPELYPQRKKGGRVKKMTSNYDTRYSLAFQLPQTDENAIQRMTRSAVQLIMILNSAAIMLNEDFIVASWRKRLEFAAPPEKISVSKDLIDPVHIKLLTPGNLYISRGGWVNTKVRIGTFHDPEAVVKNLKEALALVGTTTGRAEICPILAEEVDTLGWFYMSSEALRPSRLALSIKDELDNEGHCSYRNIFIPRQKELNKETGEQEDKWGHVSAIHIDCRTEDVNRLMIPLKECFTGELTEFTRDYLLPDLKFVLPWNAVRGSKMEEYDVKRFSVVFTDWSPGFSGQGTVSIGNRFVS